VGLGLRRGLTRAATGVTVLWARALGRVFGPEEVAELLKKARKRNVTAVLRAFGATVGADCDIESGLVLHNTGGDFSGLHVGQSCHIGKEVFLDLKAPIVVGERATVSMRTMILTHTDVGHAGPFERGFSHMLGSVEIGVGAYIGAGATILPGVKIGAATIIGAGALVNKDVPDRTTAAGVPARPVRGPDR
jgi:acetyltransferase-like isoleucine patch superfamily enzyme